MTLRRSFLPSPVSHSNGILPLRAAPRRCPTLPLQPRAPRPSFPGSYYACRILMQSGFPDVLNLDGAFTTWASYGRARIEPPLPRAAAA